MVILTDKVEEKACSKVHFLILLDIGAVHESIGRTLFHYPLPFTSHFNNAATTLLALTLKQESLFGPIVLSATWLRCIPEGVYMKLHYITYSDNAMQLRVCCSSSGIRGTMYTTSADVLPFCESMFNVASIQSIFKIIFVLFLGQRGISDWQHWQMLLTVWFLSVTVKLSDVCTRKQIADMLMDKWQHLSRMHIC